MRTLRSLAAGAVLAALVVLTGCSSAGTSPSSTGPSAAPVPSGDAAFRARAQHVAAGWTGSADERRWRTGYIPLTTPVLLPTDAFHNAQDKEAFLRGSLRLQAPVPRLFAPSTVRWPDGSSLALPTLDPVRALLAGRHAPCTSACPAPLVVTAVTPTALRLSTSRGTASVPAWSLRLRGYDQPFTAAAVQGAAVPRDITAEPAIPAPDGGDNVGLTAVSADGRTLTVGFGFGTCAEPRRTSTGVLRYETKDTVVLEGWYRAPARTGVACAGAGHGVEVRVRLDAPLGTRTVLDISGHPLQVVELPQR